MSSLSSDRPLVDPKDDLFGHAPFGKSLAGIGVRSCFLYSYQLFSPIGSSRHGEVEK